MASQSQKLHFILFPFMAQGHMIPMIDIATMLAQNGMIVTIVTTPLNAKRYSSKIATLIQSGLQIQFLEVQFPCQEAGLPSNCESLDMLPTLGLAYEFFTAPNLLQEQVERLFMKLTPKPSCIISDFVLPYTNRLATKYCIPRISFSGFSCFTCVLNQIFFSKVLEGVKSESEYFLVPGLPDRIELTKNQMISAMVDMKDFHLETFAAEAEVAGIIVNSFQELEPAYVQEYEKSSRVKVWCVGPTFLCKKDNKPSSSGEHECLKWLHTHKPLSVIYVCLGSICNLVPPQLVELGLGLEASGRPFIWVIRDGENSREVKKWAVEYGFEERTKGRGFLIWGWAPQMEILPHRSIGGFLTHCGWNSVLEGISTGTPMVTWPLFGDQFCNERLVVDVMGVGVKVGAEVTMRWGEEEKIGVLVKREDVKNAVERLMEEGQEREERKRRVQELSMIARKAMEEEGSSQLNMKGLIQHIMQLQIEKPAE